MSDPVRFQQINFRNLTGIEVAVATKDDDGGKLVDRGKVGPNSRREIHVGLSNCRSVTVRAVANPDYHMAEEITLNASPSGKDFITNAEVAYHIGSFRYRLTLTSADFTNESG